MNNTEKSNPAGLTFEDLAGMEIRPGRPNIKLCMPHALDGDFAVFIAAGNTDNDFTPEAAMEVARFLKAGPAIRALLRDAAGMELFTSDMMDVKVDAAAILAQLEPQTDNQPEP
jgi:hypothetical protein